MGKGERSSGYLVACNSGSKDMYAASFFHEKPWSELPPGFRPLFGHRPKPHSGSPHCYWRHFCLP